MAQNDLMTRRGRTGGALTPFVNDNGLLGPSSFFGSSPFTAMRRMMEEMDRFSNMLMPGMMSSSLLPAMPGETLSEQLWSPSVDVSESIKHWSVEVDLPGVNKDDIDVQVRDHSLTIRAEMKQSSEPQQEGDQRRYHRRERRYGYFERVIPLPENVDEDHIGCSFHDGVLMINIPKSESAQQQGRKIMVTGAPETSAPSGALQSGTTQSGQSGASGNQAQNPSPS
jgi:HSP20 family protein